MKKVPFHHAALLLSTLVFCFTAHFSARAQQDSKEALARMKTAPGLVVSLFAAEDQLVNPTAMDIDAHGRVWVTEAANYRLFNYPAARKSGDRVRVLEDTDGDGVCDRATTFYEDPSLQAPLGIAVLGDRVYVCQSPDLFYLEDTDGDGLADKKTVILTGFGGVDHDHAIHGIMAGPDGLIYMTVGDGGLDVTDKSGNRIVAGKASKKPTFDAATVLRCDLNGNHLELLAEGMRNPYEPTINSFGTVFGSDNDDDGNEQVQINYVMEGGHYGYWPRRLGDRRLDSVHWNKDRAGVMPNMIRTGFGSPTGILFYEGDTLPARLQNTLIHADAGPGVIRSYKPVANGAGYAGKSEVLLSAPEDKWFRPSDVCVAPDGSIFVADWYDPGVGGHRMGDTTRGRVYRVAPPNTPYVVPPFALTTDEGITDALASPNLARRFLGRKVLAAELKGAEVPLLHKIYQDRRPVVRGRALWLLGQEKNHGLKVLLEAAQSESVAFRVQAVRLLAAQGPESLYQADWLVDDDNAMVRRQLLVELRNFPDSITLDDWLIRLALQYDGRDRFYREAIGIAFSGRERWGFERLQKELGGRWDERLSGLALQLHPPEAQALSESALNNDGLGMTPRLVALDVLDAIGTEATGQILVELARNTDSELAFYEHALHHLSRNGGQDWRAITRGAGMDEALLAALDNPERSKAAWKFLADTKRRSIAPHLVLRAKRSELSLEDRLITLGSIKTIAPMIGPREADGIVKDLAALLEDNNGNVRNKTLAAIQDFRGAASQAILLARTLDSNQDLGLRKNLAKRLAGTQSGAIALLDAVEQGKLPSDLHPQVSDQIHNGPFEDARMMAQQLLPRDASAGGKALPPMADLVAMAGDPSKGKRVFFSEDLAQCHRCHRVGDKGKEVGPNLTVIGQKSGREALLESILFPSAAISHEYEVWIVETEWDGFLSGFVMGESDKELKLMDATGTVKTLEKGSIIEKRKSVTSLMPTGLAASLSAQDLSDLVAYLASLK
jgi:putative membrane-bound dehydrogenase-like protein